MARWGKTGLEYFSLDVYLDTKAKLVEAKYGLEGFAILIKLYQHIYSQGYFCNWTEDDVLVFCLDRNLEKNKTVDLISFMIGKNIFHKGLYEKYSILTSSGIQKRYVQGTQRRKNVEFIREYLLIEIEEKTYPKGTNISVVNIDADKPIEKPKKENKSLKNSTEKEGDVFNFFSKNISPITPFQSETISSYLDDGIEPEMILEVFKDSMGKRDKWSWIQRVLSNSITNGIKTLEKYEFEKKERKVSEGAKEHGGAKKRDAGHVQSIEGVGIEV